MDEQMQDKIRVILNENTDLFGAVVGVAVTMYLSPFVSAYITKKMDALNKVDDSNQ
mgnify:CR=1 FL=1